jgi:ABC-type multidrug transport system fused ATPase/permease subunit
MRLGELYGFRKQDINWKRLEITVRRSRDHETGHSLLTLRQDGQASQRIRNARATLLAVTARDTLERALAIVGPSRRKAFAIFTAAGLIGGALRFAESDALERLTESAIAAAGSKSPLSAAVVLFCGAVLAVRLLYRITFGIENVWTGRVEQEGESELERAVLVRVIHSTDGAVASAGELFDAAQEEVKRAAAARLHVKNLLTSTPLCIASIAYLGYVDWRLGLGAVVFTGVSIAWGRLGARMLSALDDRYARAAAAIRGRLREVVRGAAEIELHDSAAQIANELAFRQAPRESAGRASWNIWAVIRLVDEGLVALALIGSVLGAVVLSRAGLSRPAAALIPVIVRAMPDLFVKANEVATEIGHFTRALASAVRIRALLPAPTRAASDGEPLPNATELTLEKASFRYRGRGGVSDVTLTLRAGSWVAIVGASGAGKSTLVELLLGQRRPESGHVRVGGRDLTALSRTQRAALFTFMPQTIAVVEGTVEENLRFGTAAGASAWPPEALAVVNAVGVGALCRSWALDLYPAPEDATGPLATRLEALRSSVRAHVEAVGITLVPLSSDLPRADPWVAEILCGAPVHRASAMAAVLSRSGRRKVAHIDGGAPGALADLGRHVVSSTEALLELPDHARYEVLAPRGLPEPIWRLRRQARSGDPSTLAQVGLLASLSEFAGKRPAVDPRSSQEVRKIVDRALVPLSESGLNPALTWRENFLFAAVKAGNSRAFERADRAILAAMSEAGLDDALLRLGLQASVARDGGSMSGGQRQLVALARALLRDTPVIVLDEPTSALDPESRTRVSEVLRGFARDRIVVTITHNAELARAASELVVVEAGRIASHDRIAGTGAAA